MMRKILFVCVLLMVIGGNAQDLLVISNGEEIEVKVLEITPDNVKYKKHNNSDGPLYTIDKNEVKEIIFENGEREVFIANVKDTDSRRAIFIKTTEDSHAHPTHQLWEAEMERYGLRKVNSVEEADLIFEFRIRRGLGEARVRVVVYDSENNELWKSKSYRGTTNAFNRMSPTFHAISKCMEKGVMREMEKGSF